jgi:CubicO group peptidase (beta-lactamase class C family)
MESGINARAIDFAKFGRLYLKRGEWDGEQVVPASWVEQSTRVETTTDPADFYQYFWWVDVVEPERGRFMARGNLGQFIYVVPDKDLVIVRFGRGLVTTAGRSCCTPSPTRHRLEPASYPSLAR